MLCRSKIRTPSYHIYLFKWLPCGLNMKILHQNTRLGGGPLWKGRPLEGPSWLPLASPSWRQGSSRIINAGFGGSAAWSRIHSLAEQLAWSPLLSSGRLSLFGTRSYVASKVMVQIKFYGSVELKS